MMGDHEAATKLKEKFEAIDVEMGFNDHEQKHAVADGFLCEILRELGYTELVDVYDSCTRWCG
jgi:hypothetical protein